CLQLAKAIEGTLAGPAVSLADLVMLAGAHAVWQCNGPDILLRIGRPDAPGPDPEGRLPDENSSAALLKANFADKGFSARELVALSGAHTIGKHICWTTGEEGSPRSGCVTRPQGNKGFGGPYAFDNTYYKELLKKPWTNTKDSMASMIGLPSDHVLPDDEELQPIIQEYAKDQEAFFKDFSAAYVKLSELGIR
ncbi:heme peroxidase, partial [Dunaliella salina]